MGIKKFLLQKSIIIVLYIIFSVILEIITFNKMGMGFLPKYFVLDFILIFVIASILFVIPFSIATVVASSILLIMQSAVSFANINIYTLRNDIFSMDMLNMFKEATDKNVLGFVSFGDMMPYVLCVIFFVFLSVITLVFVKTKFNFKLKTVLILVFIMIFSSTVSPIFYSLQLKNLYVDTESENILKSDDTLLYKYMTSKISFYKKFGTFTFYFKNVLLRQSVGGGVNDEITYDEFYDYFASTEYYEHNQYWNMDNGNNLIVVMMESTDLFLIHPKYTPTLYNLKNAGIDFTNHHNLVGTDVSEAHFILGSYPSDKRLVASWGAAELAENGWADDLRNENTKQFLEFSVPNILKNNGFETAKYFIPQPASFYSREHTHVSWGFDNVYFEDSYDTESMRPEGDSFDYLSSWVYPEKWFWQLAIDDILPQNQRFFPF